MLVGYLNRSAGRGWCVVAVECKDIETSEHRSMSRCVSRCIVSALYVFMRI
jgi:hypothetical protein